jgi:oxygen-independent coproporphyrinogen-3 oxidase
MEGFAMQPDLDRLQTLLPRYDVAGPRYTSYPTTPTWTEDCGPEAHRKMLSGLDTSAPLALYIHVPFCRSLCHFCACNRVITRKPEPPARYLAVIEREMHATRAMLGGEPTVGQLHLGGGTPTHLHPVQLQQLVRAATGNFPLRQGAELSIEVDPRVTTPEHVEVLIQAGFERMSLGVQDFDPRVQEAIHRHQPVEAVAELVECARRMGFRGIGFDLIYGLPYQTEASFDRTLDLVIAIQPDRIALYSYAHVTWVARQQRGFERADLPDGERKLRIMVAAIRRLLAAGYEYVGMDHFALPKDDLARAARQGSLHRNFMGYTTRPAGALLAFGPSGISELEAGFAQSARDLGEWEDGVTEAGLATFRGHWLSEDDRRRAWVIRQIMCRYGVSASEYRAAFAESFAERFAPELEGLTSLEEDGLLQRDADGSLRVTDDGRILLRNVAMAFDAYLAEPGDRKVPIYSKTV